MARFIKATSNGARLTTHGCMRACRQGRLLPRAEVRWKLRSILRKRIICITSVNLPGMMENITSTQLQMTLKRAYERCECGNSKETQRFAISSVDVKQTVSLRSGPVQRNVKRVCSETQTNSSLYIFCDEKRVVVLEFDESLIYSRFTAPPPF